MINGAQIGTRFVIASAIGFVNGSKQNMSQVLAFVTQLHQQFHFGRDPRCNTKDSPWRRCTHYRLGPKHRTLTSNELNK